MATYNNAKAQHQTLSGTTADLVLLTQFWDAIEISNRSGTGPLSVLFGGTVPTALVAGSEIVEPGVTKLFSEAPFNGAGVVGSTTAATACHQINIVGNSNAYSVVGVSGQEG